MEKKKESKDNFWDGEIKNFWNKEIDTGNVVMRLLLLILGVGAYFYGFKTESALLQICLIGLGTFWLGNIFVVGKL